LVDLVTAEPTLGTEAAALIAPGVGVTMRTTPGGAGPKPVAEQLKKFATAVANWKLL
jgi:argininosuccinate lyase